MERPPPIPPPPFHSIHPFPPSIPTRFLSTQLSSSPNVSESHMKIQFLSMLFGEALSFLSQLHHLPAVLPQRVCRAQFQHHAVVERQTVSHLDANRAASNQRLQHDCRQIRVTQLLQQRHLGNLKLSQVSQCTKMMLTTVVRAMDVLNGKGHFSRSCGIETLGPIFKNNCHN